MNYFDIYRVSSKKKTFWLFYHSNGHNFLSIDMYCFSFYKLWFLYHFECSPKKIVHFSTWGPRYRNIREMTWRQKMTFLEDWYLEKWSLERINFYSITSSVPVLKKAPIIRNEKLYPWNWQIFNYLKAPFLTNLNPNSIWCQTL